MDAPWGELHLLKLLLKSRLRKINNATFAFQKVGLSCRETAFSLGASQAFSDGTATGTFETRFGAIVNTAFKFARFCTHNITEQVLGNALSLSLELSISLTTLALQH